MRDIALSIIVFGLLPYILARPSWGAYLLAWLGYMNPHRLCYGYMMTFPVVMVVAITTLVGMILSKEKKQMIWSREIVVLLIMLAWMGVTTTQAFFFDLALEQYTKVIKIQILTFITLMLLTSREKVHVFIWVIVLSLGFYGVKGGIFTIVHGGVYRVQGPLGTFIGGNNELALALVMTIPLMRYLHLQETRKWVKLGLIGAMLLTALAAVGSQSRGALVALLITGGIFWLKSRGKILSGLLLAAAVAATAAIMPQEWYDRMHSIKNYQEDASALGRINAWWTAYYVAKDRVTGGGFEMFRWPVFKQYAPEPERVHDVHSIYFEMLGEHGFIGLFLFLTLLGFSWLKCGSIIRKAKRDKELYWARDLAAMLQVSMVAYMTGGAFLGLAYFDYIYHLIAITAIVWHLITKPQTQAQSQSLGLERWFVPRAWLAPPIPDRQPTAVGLRG